jgi:hypothetical protein
MAEAIYNDVFGRLTWDAPLGSWLGGIDWPPGLHTEVAIRHPGTDVAAGLRTARDSLDWLMSQEEYTRRCIAHRLLRRCNDTWRDEWDPLTEDEFIRDLDLVWIGFGEDGSLLLSYDPGDLFGGHLIDAEFDPDRSFRGASLVG